MPEDPVPAELTLVPGWFGASADELSSSISDILVSVGAEVAEGIDTLEFLLDGRAVRRLRRSALVIKNDHRIRENRSAAIRNRAAIELVRTWLDDTRCRLSAA